MANSLTPPSTSGPDVPRSGSAGPAGRRLARALAVAAALVANDAAASFLSGEALDSAANVVAWIALLLVPLIGIVVFWIVHVMPEKIAHKRHHPQTQAIHTLCLLSLAFGGLLWPLAWLWAYTKPIGYKMAYGTDKHPDYFTEQEEKSAVESGAATLGLRDRSTVDLRDRLAHLEEKGVPAAELKALRADLAALEARVADADNEAR